MEAAAVTKDPDARDGRGALLGLTLLWGGLVLAGIAGALLLA
jgi:hypothetical protein